MADLAQWQPSGGPRNPARRPRRFGGPLALGLIGVNVAVWLVVVLNGGDAGPAYRWLALQPAGTCVSVTDPETFFPELGVQQCTAVGGLWRWVPGVADGAVWQLLTSAFTHVAPFHLASNMLLLFLLSPGIRGSDWPRSLAVYLLSAFGAGTAIYLFSDPASSTVGASGAIFGLLGEAFMVLVGRRRDVRLVAVLIGVSLLGSFTDPTVSWEGHLGGLVVGLAVGAATLPSRNPSVTPGASGAAARSDWVWQAMAGILVVMIALLIARTGVLR